MNIPPITAIPVLASPAKAAFIYDDAQGERQEYDFYAWTTGHAVADYTVLAALNFDLHPDVLERLSGKPLRFPGSATFAFYGEKA